MNTPLLQCNSTHVDLPFVDRTAAGTALACQLRSYSNKARVVVLGLPHGGVPVARAVAAELARPLDYLLVRKICLPGRARAIGALAEGGVEVWNRKVSSGFLPGNPIVSKALAKARHELQRLEHSYHGDGEPGVFDGCCVIVVDDGLDTGSTMRAAIKAVRARGAAIVIAAIPLAPRATVASLCEECDEVICLATPEPFHDIGQFYLTADSPRPG